MIISLIAAIAENLVIGKDNDLVWHLPDDMRYFMKTTLGHCILTGRRNYESIPLKYRPLKNRTNIVVTRQKNYSVGNEVILVNTVEQGITFARQYGESELFVIGGGEIYQQTLAIADRLYITEIKASFEGDTYFPEVERSQWKETSRIAHPIDSNHAHGFDFVVLDRVQED